MPKSEQRHRVTLVGILTVLAVWCQNAEAFNVDTKYPIVFSGSPNSYFGYSVTFGQDQWQNYWLFVGAPKANQSRVPSLVEPGAIYQCKFTALSKASSCTDEVILDDKGNEEASYYNERYYSMKDGGWLGVSLDTNHDRSLTVACAHRWEDQRDYISWKNNRGPKPAAPPVTHANGICYTMTQDLQIKNVKKYIPLLSYNNQVLKFGIPNYAFGMAGMSAHFPEHSGELILGAPGVYIWDGNAISVQLDRPLQSVSWGARSVGVGTKFAYFGYSVSSGMFSNSDPTALNVIGAPRHSYIGKVYLVTELKKNSQIMYMWEGKQMGEYFGGAVCATDLNGDGLADVIIGAPLHSNPLQNSRDHGKVYVTLNQDLNVFTELLELTGSNVPNARFGSAIGCLGDLDQDHNKDIAVGAPYEDDGAGAVYIYYGHTHNGIAEDLVQKLSAKEIDRNLRGFGISFAKSLDIDRNSFSDLGIGSYVSDQAVILRTRRVVIPNIKLKTTPDKVGVDSFMCNYRDTKVRCFNASICFAYSTESSSLSELVFEFELRIDIYHKGEAARGNIFLNGALRQFVPEEIKVDKRSAKCKQFQVYLRNDIRHYVPPIVVSVKSALKNCSTQQPPDYFEKCPVVHPHSRMHVTSEVSFLKGCKDGSVCESDLQLKASVMFKNNAVLNPTLKPGVNKTVTINITVVNAGEHAYLSELIITFPRKLSLEKTPTVCGDGTSNELHRYSICDIGNPLTRDGGVFMQLTINVEKLSWLDKELNVSLKVKTGSNDTNMKNNQVYFQIPVLTEADIYVVGTQSDQYISYANYSEREAISINFTHHYHVINLGPATLPKVQVKIQVPERSKDTVFLKNAFVNTTDGNKGARVTECRGASAHHFTDAGDDRDTINTPEAVRRRRKREANQSSPPHRGTTLFCSNTIQCRTIECDVAMMKAEDSIAISVIMEVDHKELDSLQFEQEIFDFTTRADAEISNVQANIQPVEHKPDFAEVITTLDSGRSGTESLAAWVIPVSIIAGFLLLILVALIFYKVGFFQRHQRDAMKQRLQEGEGTGPTVACSQNPLMDDELTEEQLVQQQT